MVCTLLNSTHMVTIIVDYQIKNVQAFSLLCIERDAHHLYDILIGKQWL
jgi:hypothetical protein